MKRSEMAELAKFITWREVGEIYLDALHRCELYMKANPDARASNPVTLAMGGLTSVYPGLKPVFDDASRYDELASPEMATSVLALARRIHCEVPEATVGHA
jgi:hypothetical protein